MMPRHSGVLFVAGAIGCLTLVGIGGSDFAPPSSNAMDAAPAAVPPAALRSAVAAAPVVAPRPPSQAPSPPPQPVAASPVAPWTPPQPCQPSALSITSPESAVVHVAVPHPAWTDDRPVVSAATPRVHASAPPAVSAGTSPIDTAGTPLQAHAGAPVATRDTPGPADAPDDSTPVTTSAPVSHGYPFSAHF